MRALTTILISAALLGAGIGLFIKFGKKADVNRKTEEEAGLVRSVKTQAIRPWDQSFDLKTDGEAVTYRIITIGSEVQGRVKSKSKVARGGTFVEKGAPLFEIDDTNYQLEKSRLEAALIQADEELKATRITVQNNKELIKLAEEDVQLRRNQVARMKTLLGRNAANESEVEDATRQELTARNALQTLKNSQATLAQQLVTRQAQRTTTEFELKRVHEDIARCVIKSPLEGRIVDDLVEEGDYVRSGDDIVHISDGSRMEVKTKLMAEELAWVWQQNRDEGTQNSEADPLNLPQVECKVGFEFEGITTYWKGRLERIEGTGIDRETRTFPCRVVVEKPRETFVEDSAGGPGIVSPPTLLSGMFVDVVIPVESPLALLQIPLPAVRPGGRVWLMKDGKLKIKKVSLVHVNDEVALIRRDGSGLADGDRVIVSPLPVAIEGTAIREAVVEVPAVENPGAEASK